MTNVVHKTSAPWRIGGVVLARSALCRFIEETKLKGTLLGIEEINSAGGVNGRELMPVVYDPGSDLAACGHFAKRLMIEDDVSTIFGCYTSSSRKAVLPVVERTLMGYSGTRPYTKDSRSRRT